MWRKGHVAHQRGNQQGDKRCTRYGVSSVVLLRLRLLLRYLRCGKNTAKLHLGLASHRNIAFTLAVAVTFIMAPQGEKNCMNLCEFV